MKESIEKFELDIFKYMTNSDNQFFFLGDFETGQCRWSDNAKDVFMLSQDNTGAFDWKKLIHPSDYEAFVTAYEDIQRRHTLQFCEEYRFLLRSGEYVWISCSGRTVFSTTGEKVILSGLVTKLEIRGHFDPVTNLRYISNFRAQLDHITKHSTPFGVLIFGIDDFKRINNLYSYSFGDIVLSDFALRLEKMLPKNTKLYRLDGDSFGIIYPNGDVTTLIDLFEQISNMSQQVVVLQNISVSLTISGGICRYPDDGTDSDTIYRNGRIAFTESKHRGKKQVTICSESLCLQVQRRMKLLETMRESVYNDCEGFSLRYQPLIYAENEQLYGCEVLLRWLHPEFPDGVSPYEFIPVLEESGLIFEVNKWLLKEAFSQCSKWVEIMPTFQMNINVSCSQFEDPDFKFFVMKMLIQENVPASSITLELTESGEVTDMDVVNDVFSFFRSQGIKIALDDFGIGYSSLSIFQMLKADELKIDRSFLQRLTYNVTDQALVRQIIELCHSMNMMVCVEGVESGQVTKIVKEFGPELLQGFYYGHPLTKEEYEERYFSDKEKLIKLQSIDCKRLPEEDQSLVYAALRPTEPMSMDEIVNNANAGIFQVAMDSNFSFITCNEGYRKMLGYTPRDIEVKFNNHALGIVHHEDVEYVNNEVRRQLGQGDSISSEFRVVRSDGTPIWVAGSGNVVRTSDGSTSLIVVIIDINNVRTGQLEIEQKYKLYSRILSNIPVGVKCVQNNENFDIDYMSPAFLSLLGYDEKDLNDLFNRKYINMVVEEDKPVVVSDVIEQSKRSDIVTLRYRSRCKDGSTMWLETISKLCPAEEDGIQHWYSSVVNIDASPDKQKIDRVKDFANRLQSASVQWGDVLFEYDFTTETISFSDNYEKVFGREPQKDFFWELNNIYADDRKLLDESIKQMHKGLKPQPIEIRFYGEERGYFWVSVIFSEPNVLGSSPVSIVGRICDIDREKKQKEELLHQSKIDGLTGVFNKKNIEKEIRSVISKADSINNQYAFCILDIDNFKGINDKKGHMFGDIVLAETAKRLCDIADENTLIGRAGGDEFILFTKLGGGAQDADALGKRIIDALCRPIEFEGKSVEILSSAGIALYPQGATDFYKLYKLADSALYLVKARGKGDYHIAVNSI